MTSLQDKVVVVTGAGRGLGRAFARALAAAGARLVLGGRDVTALARVADELRSSGSRVEIVPGGVEKDGVAEDLVDRAVRVFGRLDGLVNNAGLVRDRSALKMTRDEFDEVVAVDLRGAWACGRFAAAAMTADGGSIVNIISDVAITGTFGQSNYAAAKAGLLSLTVTWAHEWARYGIRVNAVGPAALTDMSAVVLERATAAAPAGEAPSLQSLGMGLPDQIAPLIVQLVGPAPAELTGQVISFDGVHLGLWSPPRIEHVVQRADGWTAEAIGALFADGTLRPRPPAETFATRTTAP